VGNPPLDPDSIADSVSIGLCAVHQRILFDLNRLGEAPRFHGQMARELEPALAALRRDRGGIVRARAASGNGSGGARNRGSVSRMYLAVAESDVSCRSAGVRALRQESHSPDVISIGVEVSENNFPFLCKFLHIAPTVPVFTESFARRICSCKSEG